MFLFVKLLMDTLVELIIIPLVRMISVILRAALIAFIPETLMIQIILHACALCRRACWLLRAMLASDNTLRARCLPWSEGICGEASVAHALS